MTSKKHHYLPQFYLKQWANNKSQVWVYRKKTNPFLTNIINVGVQNNLLSIEGDDSIEKWASEIDGDLATIYNDLYSHNVMKEDTALKLKAFFIVLLTRNPNPIAIQSSKNLIRYDLSGANPNDSFSRTLRIRTKSYAMFFESFHVQIIKVPKNVDFTFISSDLPFYFSSQNGWIPLAPKLLALYHSNPVEIKLVIEENKEQLQKYNRHISRYSREFLISNSKDLFTNENELKLIFDRS